jgi:hypothetical protein
MASKEAHYDANRQWQEHYDNKLAQIGMRAPAPVLGQTTRDYRIDTLVKAKKEFIPRTHKLRQFSLDDVTDATTFDNFDRQIIDTAIVEAQNPANVPPGTLRRITKEHPQSGHKMNVFYGQDHFVKLMPNYRPGRRVVGFLTPQGYMNTNGQFRR